MQGVLAGFFTIGAVVGVGMLLARLGILDESSQRVLARLAFFVASPALMIIVLGDTDVAKLFSANLLASIAGVAVSATTLRAARPAGLETHRQRHGDRAPSRRRTSTPAISACRSPRTCSATPR